MGSFVNFVKGRTSLPLFCHVCRRNYAVKRPSALYLGRQKLRGKVTEVVEKTEVPVETDAKILVSYVCGTNLFLEGGENIKIKADSEYPDWLWKLHIGEEKRLDEMDPSTLEYWEKVQELGEKKEKELTKRSGY